MKIAITGGIGSGKSTVIEELKKHLKDYVFISVDEAAEGIYTDPTIKNFMEVMGITTKRQMSDVFFNNHAVRERFEALANPLIEKALENSLKMEKIVVEFPLLYRQDFKKYLIAFDLIISVTAPTEDRIKRVMLRNPTFTREKIESIIDLQPEQEYVDVHSHMVFENKVSKAELANAVKDMSMIIAHKSVQHESTAKSKEVMSRLRKPQGKVGLVPGSFDPIQRGHLYVIQKALTLVDTVRVVVAYNDKKSPMFTKEDKSIMIKESILEILGPESMARVRVDFLDETDLLVTHAQTTGAKHIFRGLRSGFDFDYEHGINAAQHDIDDSIETIYIMTPNHLTHVSSSLVKTLMKYEAARPAVVKAVPAAVLKVIDKKISAKREDR